MNFMELFREFLEEVKRYSTPYAFISYVRDLVSKHFMHVMVSHDLDCGCRECKCVLVEDLIEVPTFARHSTVLAVAFYDDDSEFIVKIGDGVKVFGQVVKAKGMNWVPLILSEGIVIYVPGRRIVIEPKPKSVAVIRLEPGGEE